MTAIVVRTLGELGPALTMAPERYLAARLGGLDGTRARGLALSSLVVERNERVVGPELARAVVLDTSHAKDGLLDVRAAALAAPSTSAKKRVREGDLLVSRLRPYLRQIALAHPAAVAVARGRVLACSTEFHVFRSPDDGDLAYLIPFLLGSGPQRALIAGQEGGHHPRVPKETLLGLVVDQRIVARRGATSRAVRDALGALYAAAERYREVIG